MRIYFNTYTSVKKVLHTVLSMPPFCHYTWFVREYWVFSYGNGMDDGWYSPEKMMQSIMNLTDDENAELFTFYGVTSAQAAAASSTEQGCNKEMCEAVLRCYDAIEYDFCCGDEEALKCVMEALVDRGICEQGSFKQWPED